MLDAKTDDEERVRLEAALIQLFGSCQCLPNASDRAPWVGGENREVVLVVNPAEFHADVFSNTSTAKRKRRKVTKTNADSRSSLVDILGPHLTAQDRRFVQKSYQPAEDRKAKFDATLALALGGGGSDTDNDQPPAPRRGGKRTKKRVGRPRKNPPPSTKKTKAKKKPQKESSEEEDEEEGSNGTSPAKRVRFSALDEEQSDVSMFNALSEKSTSHHKSGRMRSRN